MKGKKASIYFSALIAFLMLILILPLPSAFSWSYGRPGVADDLTYEKFGPRSDRLLITLYTSEISEWEQGLELAKLDVTDWPLDDTHYNRYTTPPWNNTLKVLGYGPEFGLYLFDLNNNNNQYLGNPPNPSFPNPVYPNPMSELAMRKAVALLTNRAAYIAFLGPTTSTAMYTPVGPSSGKYADTDIAPGGAREDLAYLYNPVLANQTLDAGGFPVDPVTHWRTWTGHGTFTLKIVARVDSPPRDYAANDIYTSLLHAGVHCTIQHMPSGSARAQVMAQKNFHIYTGGWSLTVDPDFLTLWAWAYYWHPGNPMNYAGCNNAVFNAASEGVQYANDQAEAVVNAWACQLAFAENVLSVPLWISTGFKAVSRTYVGGTPAEAAAGYTGQYWEGFVNVPGYGVDSGYTFGNLHPEGNATGSGVMTVRYAFKQQEIKMFNPIYAEWLWDNTVIDLIGYDSLVGRNPYNLGQFESLVAAKYSVGTYTHPTYGTCTKVVFTLRPSIEWSDGMPVTIADIFFTFVEIDGLLASRGMPQPWWISSVQDILSFSILDPYNFEVLLDVKSVFAVGWIGGSRILPKHIWKPICTTGDPTANNPDPNMINSGQWRLKEYVESSHILLLANTPDTTVTSPLAGATPIISKMGYYRYAPIIAYANATNDYQHKFNISTSINSIDVHFVNGKSEAVVCDLNASLYWNGTLLDTQTQTGISLDPGDFIWHNPWNVTPYLQLYGLWKVVMNATFPDRPGSYGAATYFWVTLKEDITGSTWYQDAGYGTYAYKNELVSGDFKVDTKDVATAAKAFGTSPGDSRWNTGADIVKDYKIDVKDIAGIAKKFGWYVPGPHQGKTYGGARRDEACSLIQISDGTYAFAGMTQSFGTTTSDYDSWLVKTDANRVMQWSKTYGPPGTSWECALSLVRTDDNYYVFAGYQGWGEHGYADAWLVKTDLNGNVQWSKTYGGALWDSACSLVQTSDGYVFAGYTQGEDYDTDAWLVKTDLNGNVQWSKTYGGAGSEAAYSLVQTPSDGGYAFAGYTTSFGAGGGDAWLVKTLSDGYPLG